MTITLISFLVLIFSGIPIVFALGVAAAVSLALTTEVPLVVIAHRVYAGLDSFPLMAIPFFTLAGLIVEKGGIARRIVDLSAALVGWITGSLYMVAIVTGTGLAALSGSGSADTAAIGSMLSPEMRRRGYDVDVGAGLIAAAGALAPIIPPSIIMIIIGLSGNISVGKLFLAGLLPGLLIAAGLMFVAWLFAKRNGAAYRDAEPFALRRLGRSLVAAGPALSLPVVVVGGIAGGVFTPTEASCVAVIVALLVSFLVHRELRIAELPELVLRAASISAAVLIIVGTANVFAWLITSQGVPALIGGYLNGMTDQSWVFLLLVNILLLVVGMFMESFSAVLVLMPVLMPIALNYGIDPVHFGLIVALNLSIGLITPPYGICLYIVSIVSKRTVGQVASQIWRPLLPMLIALALITYIPEISLALPRLLMP
ncbi:TRAP transporter large permease [Devosia sp.]|uniref:TRAP transporter large permease n=1 Tax=Devosia sp. TaxID=1871048 RepID=UPI002F0FBD8E